MRKECVRRLSHAVDLPQQEQRVKEEYIETLQKKSYSKKRPLRNLRSKYETVNIRKAAQVSDVISPCLFQHVYIELGNISILS